MGMIGPIKSPKTKKTKRHYCSCKRRTLIGADEVSISPPTFNVPPYDMGFMERIMIQSNMLISKRRTRAVIFRTYDQLNPDNKPREISKEVFIALDTALRAMITDMVEQETCVNGRLKDNGHFVCGYQA